MSLVEIIPPPSGSSAFQALQCYTRRVRPPQIYRVLLALFSAACVTTLICAVVGVWIPTALDLLRATPTPPGAGLGPAGTPLPASPLPAPTGEPSCGAPPRMNVLLLGVDARHADYDRPMRTDAITVAGIDFAGRRASLLSIPRDLWVAIPNLAEHGVTEGRINTAYFNGEKYNLVGGGPRQARDTVTLNFGIRLDRHVVVHFRAFEAGVDAIGGIEVDVPAAVHDDFFPTDDGGTTVIDIPAGRQHMDGRTALIYARTRHQDNDFERMRRQQIVMLAIRDKLISPEILPRLPDLWAAVSGSVRTDLSPADIAALACVGAAIEQDDISRYVIDGQYVQSWVTQGGAQVVIPNREKIAPIVREFNGE